MLRADSNCNKASLLDWSSGNETNFEPCILITKGSLHSQFKSTGKRDMDCIFANCHGRNMGHKNASRAKACRSLTIAGVFCLLFMVAQAIGGYAAGSLAIMTDAAHLFSDFISLMISLFSLCLTKRKPSIRMTFGWHRAEVMGALVSIGMIWGITATLVCVAIARLKSGHFDIKAELMLITAAIGVCFNIVMAIVLHKAGDIGMHGHSHGAGSSKAHAHDDNESNSSEDDLMLNGSGAKNKKHSAKQRLSVRAALLHVASDFLQSFAVLMAAVVIYCKPQMAIIDPMCTFLFSILVLTTTLPILKEVLTVIMEGAPSGVDLENLIESLLKVDGVQGVTNLRVWSLNTDHLVCSVHLEVDVMLYNWRPVLEQATNLLTEHFHIDECTIQIVPKCDSRLMNGSTHIDPLN